MVSGDVNKNAASASWSTWLDALLLEDRLKLVGIVLVVLAVAAAAGAPADDAGMLRLRDDVSGSSFAYDPEYWREIKPTKQGTSRRSVAMFNSANMLVAQCTLQASPFSAMAEPLSVHQGMARITEWFMAKLRSEYPDARLIAVSKVWVGQREALRFKREYTQYAGGGEVPMISESIIILSPTHDILMDCIYVKAVDQSLNLGKLVRRQIEIILHSLKVAPDPSDA
jgi:hypothetical protein